MSEEDEENVFDEDEAEFKKSLEVMYDLAFYLTEQRERLKMIRQRAEAGADVIFFIVYGAFSAAVDNAFN